MITIHQRVAAAFRSVFRSRPREALLNWARRCINLSTEESGDFPGRYDPELNPLPTILFEVYESGEYDEAWFKKSSQSGVTLAVLILFTWFARFVRRNFSYMLDTRDEMKKVSKARLQPMLIKTGGGANFISPDPDDLTALTMYFKGFVGYFMGAQSVGALANKSVALACCDEVDTYVEENERKESGAVSLVRDRLKKQMNSFLIGLSKPRNFEDTTNQEFLTGTRHKCFLPCPHCGYMQELVFERLIFSQCKRANGTYDFDRVERETYYQCMGCDAPIHEHHKPAMIAKREWRRTNFGQDKWQPVPRKFSCEISDLYSTFPKTTWGILAKEWLEAQGDIQKIKAFKRGRLAQAWEDKKPEVRETDVKKCIGDYDYEQGHCPVVPDVVFLNSDRQEAVFKWVKTAWRFDVVDECFVVDEGECGTWDDLMRAADRPVIVDHWGDVPEAERINPIVFTGMIDEGHQTNAIRKLCLSTGKIIEIGGRQEIVLRFYPIKGRGGLQVKDMIWEVESKTDEGWPITVYHISDDDFKSMLYEEAINGRVRVQKHQASGEIALAPLLHIFKEPDPKFIAELCQERRKPAIVRNKPVLIWDEPKGKNDKGDALKYAFANAAKVRSLFPRRRLTEIKATEPAHE